HGLGWVGPMGLWDPAPPTPWAYPPTLPPSVRRFFQRLQQNEPALAVGSRSAGERHREREGQRRDLPVLLRAAGIHRDAERPEQVVGRFVIAVRVLDAGEDRELAPRPHVDFVLPDAVHHMVVDTFGVLPVAIAARLPVPFEHVARIAAERAEQLRGGGTNGDPRGNRGYTDEKPGGPGGRQTHGAPFDEDPWEAFAEYHRDLLPMDTTSAVQ